MGFRLVCACMLVATACGGTTSESSTDGGVIDAGGDAAPSACAEAKVPTLVAQVGPPGLNFIALDTQYVYAAGAAPDGQIIRVPKCGGATETLLSGIGAALGVSVHSGEVYFVEQGPTAWESRILRGPATGGAAQALAQDQGSPWTVLVDGNGVYWANTFSNGINALPHGASTATELAWDRTRFAAFAADDSHLYFAGNQSMARVPKGGGAVEALAPADPEAWCAAVDEAYLYWTTYTGSVHRVSKIPGGATFDYGLSGYHRCLVVDEAYVYVADDGFTAGVYRLPKSGGAAEKLHDGDASSVAVDDSQLFWSGAGGLWRLAR